MAARNVCRPFKLVEPRTQRNLLITFHHTGCLIGILTVVYFNPHMTGQYNLRIYPKEPGFFLLLSCLWRRFFVGQENHHGFLQKKCTLFLLQSMGFSGKWMYLQDEFSFRKKKIFHFLLRSFAAKCGPRICLGGIFGNKLNPYTPVN